MAAQKARLLPHEIKKLVDEFHRDGFCILKNHFSRETLETWGRQMQPRLDTQVKLEGSQTSRGANRYYLTLPFEGTFADPAIYENDEVLEICSALVGKDMVLCQLGSDTPLLGSDYQGIHRDTQPLFPEAGIETPPFQLAVNFPLVDVTSENGPFEVIRGTHIMSRDEGLARYNSGELKLEPITMNLGDVMVRDVRALHRGTPNRTNMPRPMVVLGYSRSWLHRPEVSIQIPNATWEKLTPRAKQLLRFNPRVERLEDEAKVEAYQVFAY